MIRKAVFPGSFDPYTIGHHDIVSRSLAMFDEVVIAVGINSTKKYLNTLEERLDNIKSIYKEEPKVIVDTYQELTISYCKKIGANFVLRGLRNSVDFNYERNIALMNLDLDASIETIFLISSPEYSHINSSVVKEIILNGGDASQFLP